MSESPKNKEKVIFLKKYLNLIGQSINMEKLILFLKILTSIFLIIIDMY